MKLDSLRHDFEVEEYDIKTNTGTNIWYLSAAILSLQIAVPRYYKHLKHKLKAKDPLTCGKVIHEIGIEKNDTIQKETVKLAKRMYKVLEG